MGSLEEDFERWAGGDSDHGPRDFQRQAEVADRLRTRARLDAGSGHGRQ